MAGRRCELAPDGRPAHVLHSVERLASGIPYGRQQREARCGAHGASHTASSKYFDKIRNLDLRTACWRTMLFL